MISSIFTDSFATAADLSISPKKEDKSKKRKEHPDEEQQKQSPNKRQKTEYSGELSQEQIKELSKE